MNKHINLKIPEKAIYDVIKNLIKEKLCFSVYPQSDGSYYIETDIDDKDNSLVELLQYFRK